MARDAVAIHRLIDPNPREVTEADATRIYCCARARLAHVSITKFSLKLASRQAACYKLTDDLLDLLPRAPSAWFNFFGFRQLQQIPPRNGRCGW
jgi:hypothetical protein